MIEANRTTEPVIDEAALLRDVKAKEVAHARMIDRFEKEMGVKMGPSNPVPIEKAVPTISAVMSEPVLAPTPAANDGQQPQSDQSPADVSGEDASS